MMRKVLGSPLRPALARAVVSSPLDRSDAYRTPSGGLGPELVTNGTFTGGGTGWVAALGNWLFEDDWAVEDGLGSLGELSQTLGLPQLEDGHTYRVSFEIVANSESADVYITGAVGKVSQLLMTRSAIGVHTADVLITAGMTLEDLQITNDLSELTIDNVSIREVL